MFYTWSVSRRHLFLDFSIDTAIRAGFLFDLSFLGSEIESCTLGISLGMLHIAGGYYE